MAGFYGRTGVEIRGTLTAGLESAALRLRPAMINATETAAEVIRERAYNNANVSPGELGHGIHGEHMRDEIRLATREYPSSVSTRIAIDMVTIPYAAHQEFGPRGNRFMTRAVDESREECREIMRSVLSAELIGGKVSFAVRMRNYA